MIKGYQTNNRGRLPMRHKMLIDAGCLCNLSNISGLHSCIKEKKSRGFLSVVGESTYSDGSIEQATSRSAGDNSEYRVDNRRRRSNADGRWPSRQPESRSHRTTIHRPAQRSTQCLFAPDRKNRFTSSRLN